MFFPQPWNETDAVLSANDVEGETQDAVGHHRRACAAILGQ